MPAGHDLPGCPLHPNSPGDRSVHRIYRVLYAALLVAIGARRDGSKVVLAVEAGHRESSESWSRILRNLKARGMNCPKLVMGDGHLGIWGALTNVYPEAGEQRCWNHRTLNVLDRVPQKDQTQAKVRLTQIAYAETKQEAERLKEKFQEWSRQRGFEKAGQLLEEDWDRLVAYYSFPQEHWVHLRTPNVVESPFAAVRLRTDAAKRYKKADNATAVIWKVLMVAESRFRRLNAPELVAEVAAGVIYENGRRVMPPERSFGIMSRAPRRPSTRPRTPAWWSSARPSRRATRSPRWSTSWPRPPTPSRWTSTRSPRAAEPPMGSNTRAAGIAEHRATGDLQHPIVPGRV